MAIIKEFYVTREDGVDLYITYSDEGYKIQKVGTDEIYDEAIDVLDYEYEETDELVDVDNELELKAQAYDILTGEME